MSLYADLPGAKISTSIEVAEIVKYVDNTWHALKVAFGNEVGVLAKALSINSHEVMDIFFEDQTPQYFTGVSAAGICVRGIVPAEGSARAHVPRTQARPFAPGSSIISSTAIVC